MTINFLRLNHVQICIPVGKEQEAREFYCDFLGLEEIEKPDILKKNGGFWLMVADIELHVGTEQVENHSKRHPAFEVEQLEEIREMMTARGLKLRESPDLPGFRRFSFYDPFNNRIELLEKIGDQNQMSLSDQES